MSRKSIFTGNSMMSRLGICAGSFLIGISVCLLAVAQSAQIPDPRDYSVPTWTKIMRMIEGMKDASMPYSISLSINGDPRTQIGIAWFTNTTCTYGMAQLVEAPGIEGGIAQAAPDFSNPTFEVDAVSELTQPLNYSNTRNNLEGIALNEKIIYRSHKCLVRGLKPGTKYYYRVGNKDGWSDIASFTTSADTPEYSFIYVTDTQGKDESEFEVSKKTMLAATRTVPDASFIMFNGDFVESWGAQNSEWEYEQWFSSMQEIWMSNKLAATPGNHDKTPNRNFQWHFNTDTSFNKTSPVKAKIDGTVYSFELGDVLYMVLYMEDDDVPGYFEALGNWMRQVVAKSTAKWRVVSFHTNMFTGSWHQRDANQVVIRDKMLPVFDELNIDIAIQGHDHLYEVIGPVRAYDMTLIEEAVSEVEDTGDAGSYGNMTGKAGGVFDVSEGTLFFLNNSACKKKYWPLSEAEMNAGILDHKVTDYFNLFSGRLGQTGEPTFTRVDVTPDKFTFTTYTVDEEGEPQLFDQFAVVKNSMDTGVGEITDGGQARLVRNGNTLLVTGQDNALISVYDTLGLKVAQGYGSTMDISGLAAGTYVVKATVGKKRLTAKIHK